MPRLRAWKRRSSVEWGVRGALAIIAALCGYVVVTHSLANALSHRDAARAHQLSPGDGRITAELAQQLTSNVNATSEDRKRADDLARMALRQDPTAVAAATTLGLDLYLRGDAPRARRVFAYADTLSRRNLEAQLWAIEDAVAQNDVSGALAHYDIALRTSGKAPDLLYPILASAISDSVVRDALSKMLVTAPPWSANFINFVAAQGQAPKATAQLFLALGRSKVAVPAEAKASVIDALVVAGENEEAWTYYASFHPGSDRRRSRDPRFTASPDVPSLFDWMPLNEGDVVASIQRDDRGGMVVFSAPPTRGGPVIRQFQMLPAGEYRLVGRSSDLDQPATSRPYWVLNCRNDGREFGRVEIPNSGSDGAAFEGRFRVPSDCALQILTLMARPSDALDGLSGNILQVALAPFPDHG